MKRPLLWTACMLCVGIFSGRYGYQAEDLFIIILSSALVFIVVTVIAVYIKWPPVYIMLAAFVLGFILTGRSLSVKDSRMEGLSARGETILMSGIAEEVYYTRAGRQRIVFRIRQANAEYDFFETNIRIQGLLPAEERVYPGQTLLLSGELLELEGPRNPGGFDEFMYWRARKVQYKSFPKIEARGGIVNSPALTVQRMDARIGSVYDAVLPQREAGVAKAMILGDKAGLDADLTELYRAGGIYHILVVSGLHMTITAVAANFLLCLILGGRKKTAGCLVLGILVFYCLMTGAGISAVRALVMSSVIIIGRMLYRPRDILTSVAFAGSLLLIYEPLYLWNAGFQYSFTAVLGLGWFTPAAERALVLLGQRIKARMPPFAAGCIQKGEEAGRKGLAGALAASAVSMPVGWWHFYYIQPYGWLVNGIILPTVSITVILGFAIGLMGMASLNLGVFFSGAFIGLLRVYEWICVFFARLPLSRILLGRGTFFRVISWYLIIILFIKFYSMRIQLNNNAQKTSSRVRNIKLALAISLFIFPLTLGAERLWPHPLEAVFLDVGQGDAVIIRKGFSVFLVDGGGWPGAEPGGNAGSGVVIPYLDHEGIGKIDGAFLTHLHEDHGIGIGEVLEGNRTSVLFMPPQKKELEESWLSSRDITENREPVNDSEIGYGWGQEKLYNWLMGAAVDNRTEVMYLRAGDRIIKEPGKFQKLFTDEPEIIIDCLYPKEPYYGDNPNDNCLVLRARYGDAVFLLTGDIGFPQEEALLRDDDIKCGILKVAHHGSMFSTGEEFLQAADPLGAVMSLGRGNSYGHPSPRVVELFMEMGIPLYATHERGAVMIETNGQDIWIRSMLKE